jgi:hypothetical protein
MGKHILMKVGFQNIADIKRTANKTPAGNIGFAAKLAGRWSNGHFIAVVLHLGWTNTVELLFVNLYFYIFNQQRLWADGILFPNLHKALLVVGKAKTALPSH